MRVGTKQLTERGSHFAAGGSRKRGDCAEWVNVKASLGMFWGLGKDQEFGEKCEKGGSGCRGLVTGLWRKINDEDFVMDERGFAGRRRSWDAPAEGWRLKERKS